MFKRIILTVILLIFALKTLCAYADITEKPEWLPEIPKPEWAPDISGETTFETKYIWRGQNLVNDPVIQPGASIGLYGFTFSVWGNYDTGTADRFTEWDYIFDYTFNIGEAREKLGTEDGDLKFLDPLSVSAGYTYYTFPNIQHDETGAHDSHEFYVGGSYDTLLQPFITYYCDFDTGSGSFWEFGGSHSFELVGDIVADAGITVGYNASQWGYDSSFSSMLFSGEVSIPIFKYFAIAPNVNYSLTLNDQYDSEFYSGIKISVAY